MTDQTIELRGQCVSTDQAGNGCLNDLWTLAGKPENRRARDWLRTKRTQALKVALDERIGENFPKSSKRGALPTYDVAGRGTGAKTFAHPVLALDYAEYLEPALGVDSRNVFLRYKSDDVTLALEISGARLNWGAHLHGRHCTLLVALANTPTQFVAQSPHRPAFTRLPYFDRAADTARPRSGHRVDRCCLRHSGNY